MVHRVLGPLLVLIGVFWPAFAEEEQTIPILVAPGDCLISICKEHLENPQLWWKIARFNRLQTPDLILPGQIIRIPVGLLKGVPARGQVSFLKGDAAYRPAGSSQWSPLALGYWVPPGSRVRTGEKSSLELDYNGSVQYFLRPSSELDINFSRARTPTLLTQEFFFWGGSLLSKIKKGTGTESRLKITTPSAVASPRGTVFRTAVDNQKITRTEVLEGEVTFSNTSGTVDIRQGEGSLARMEEPPASPRMLLPSPAVINYQSTINSLPSRIKFSEVAGAVSFRILLSRDTEGKDTLEDATIPLSGEFTIPLIEDGNYFLLTQSIDDLGLEGIPSSPQPLHIRVNPLPPLISEPRAGFESRTGSIDMSWLKVKDASAYRVQIARDTAFSALVQDERVQGTLGFKSRRLEDGTYFFRVSSVAEDGYEGASTDPIPFSVVPPPPAPSPEEPTLNRKELRLRCRDLGPGFTYHFQLARDEKFQQIVTDTTASQPEVALERPKRRGV